MEDIFACYQKNTTRKIAVDHKRGTKEKQTFSVNGPAFVEHWAMSPKTDYNELMGYHYNQRSDSSVSSFSYIVYPRQQDDKRSLTTISGFQQTDPFGTCSFPLGGITFNSHLSQVACATLRQATADHNYTLGKFHIFALHITAILSPGFGTIQIRNENAC